MVSKMPRGGGRPGGSTLDRVKSPATGTDLGLAEQALRIRKARNASGLSQAALARLLDCSAGAVGQWELGMTGPGKAKLVKLTELLDISLDDLLGGPNRKRAPAAVAPSAGLVAVDLDAALLAAARQLGIDVPAVLDAHLRTVVGRTRSERWLEENGEAIADANAFLERHGLWSDGKRQF
jgi:antitoxin CcdA